MIRGIIWKHRLNMSVYTKLQYRLLKFACTSYEYEKLIITYTNTIQMIYIWYFPTPPLKAIIRHWRTLYNFCSTSLHFHRFLPVHYQILKHFSIQKLTCKPQFFLHVDHQRLIPSYTRRRITTDRNILPLLHNAKWKQTCTFSRLQCNQSMI